MKKWVCEKVRSRVAPEAILEELREVKLVSKHSESQTMIAHYNERCPYTALAGRMPDELSHYVPSQLAWEPVSEKNNSVFRIVA